MSKKQRKNRYKAGKKYKQGGRYAVKGLVIATAMVLITLFSIFVHDLLVQSAVFRIRQIDVQGNVRLEKKEIMSISRIGFGKNALSLNRFASEKRLRHHPWIKEAAVKRVLPSKIVISITEQSPLAVVRIDNTADILINREGHAFKPYDASAHPHEEFPVIDGISLSKVDNIYLFQGKLFDLVYEIIEMKIFGTIKEVETDANTGISIKTSNFLDTGNSEPDKTVNLRLGFAKFKEKAHIARLIANYFKKNIPDRTISFFDLYETEKIFIKTKNKDALHNHKKGEA